MSIFLLRRLCRAVLWMPTKNIDSRESGRWSWNRLKRAFAAEAQDADAFYERGRMAEREKKHAQAAELYRAAAAARPGEAEFHYALAGALCQLKRGAEAVAAFRAGLALRPDDARMRNDLGFELLGQWRLDEALAEIEQARNLAPDRAEPHYNLGIAYRQFGLIDRAIAEIGLAHRLAPEHDDIHSNLLFVLNYSARQTQAEILAAHRRYGERRVQPVAAAPPDPAWPRKLRIGYVSPDFRSHVVASFMLPVIAGHDRERFHVCCYYTYAEMDHVTEAMRGLADGWADCAGLSDAELADRIRADRIDILVDLAGHTAHHRLKAFALRPAPVQVTYLGYPNTTGLTAIDFRITDARADPPGEADRLHVERLVRLPRSFLCYRPGPDLHDLGPPPAAAASRVTFGCFNSFQKLSEPFYEAAARILAAVPDSQLLLKARSLGTASVARLVKEKIAVFGIDPSRLVLLGWEATPEGHLAIYQRVDIALDSFPYNGTTTTCEALWMGAPVVALQGDRHAGRVGASLLGSVGLQELVGRDVEEYVRIATALAGDLPRLAALRGSMRQRMSASTLMDERGFVHDLEECYEGMWREKLAASAPAHGAAPASLDAAHALRQAGKPAEAKAACEAILRHQPARDDALALLWDLCHELGESAAAVDAIGRALAAGGKSAPRYYMLGCTLQDLSRTREALAAFQETLALDPGHAKAANNLGCMQEALGDLAQAEASYQRALLSDPKLANALYNRGKLAKFRGQQDAAEADLRQALALEPAHADWHCSLAELLLQQWRLDEAEACLRDALAVEPGSARAHFGLGNALVRLSRTEEAVAALRRALEIDPQLADAHSNLLFCLHYRESGNPRALYEEHLAWARLHAEGLRQPAGHAAIDRSPARRLNIGYLSPDFHRHSVVSYFEPLLAAHDRSRFRVVCYASVERPDAVTERLKRLSDEWRDIHGVPGDAAARLIREDRIDILIDLAGHTGGGRPLVFARKPAPVQIAWLGYPNTTGLAEMDYRLTDAVADPPGEADRWYTEKLLRLPQGFLCFAPDPDSPQPGEPPALAAGRVTFGCFNNLAKVSPEMIALWSRLLAEVPQARLTMKAHALASASARRSVLERFASHGIDAGRLILHGPEESVEGHLARYREVDIALDTYPYNGATTTCEALWMGVPVVTLAGTTQPSRFGATILNRLGLDEWVAAGPEEYLAKALALSADLEKLRGLRLDLRQRMRASPLLDGAGFARAVEAAYQRAWRARASPAAAPAPAVRAAGEPLRLHVGGKERKAGWKILNIQPGPEVDFVGDCSDLGQFADGSVDELYASHVLEHVGYQTALPRALAGFCRVLKPGGTASISVPDFEVLRRLFLDPRATPLDRFQVMRMAFGGQMDEHDFHCAGLSYELLSQCLFQAGFSRVERVQEFGLFIDNSTLEYLGKRVSLNVVAHK